MEVLKVIKTALTSGLSGTPSYFGVAPVGTSGTWITYQVIDANPEYNYTSGGYETGVVQIDVYSRVSFEAMHTTWVTLQTIFDEKTLSGYTFHKIKHFPMPQEGYWRGFLRFIFTG